MSTNQSIGRGPAHGSNEDRGNADGLGNKTLGEHAGEQPPAGADGVVEQAAPQVPAGVPGSRPEPGVGKGKDAYPDGPNVEASPWELEAARGNPPKER